MVDEASGGTLPSQPMVFVIAAGVGLFAAVAFSRVVLGFSMRVKLTAMYALMIALTFLAPGSLVPLAYDAGSVTTGALTGPVVLAVALGVSSVIAGRSAVNDGFGLLGVASIGPIIVLLAIAWLAR
jgi:hypothetical protein